MTTGGEGLEVVLGRNVRRRRAELELSQREVAEAAEMDAPSLCRLERGQTGRRGVGTRRIERLAAVLKTTPAALLSP